MCGVLPKPYEYALATFKCESRLEWFQHARDWDYPKYGAYNIDGVISEAPKDRILSPKDPRQTTEFQLHAGTVDGQQIVNWIKTVVGMAKYAESGDPSHFFDLVTRTWEAEKWEKMGTFDKVSDADREREMGKPLEDDGFTIIDLLMATCLTEQAEYYHDKRYVHAIIRRDLYFKGKPGKKYR